MKTYEKNQYGIINVDGKAVPTDPKNSDFARVLAEVEAGDAQIVDAILQAVE